MRIRTSTQQLVSHAPHTTHDRHTRQWARHNAAYTMHPCFLPSRALLRGVHGCHKIPCSPWCHDGCQHPAQHNWGVQDGVTKVHRHNQVLVVATFVRPEIFPHVGHLPRRNDDQGMEQHKGDACRDVQQGIAATQPHQTTPQHNRFVTIQVLQGGSARVELCRAPGALTTQSCIMPYTQHGPRTPGTAQQLDGAATPCFRTRCTSGTVVRECATGTGRHTARTVCRCPVQWRAALW